MNILLEVLKENFTINSLKIDEIKNVVMDSRKVEEGSLFFAINNGNSYIDKALSDGATLIIADNYSGNDKRVIKVNDTIIAMQEIAKQYREKLNLIVIGITGSNGKTTTKDLVYSLLKEKYKCKKTEGNYNNHIGLPYTILQATKDDEVLILEMGMSSFGEIDKLGFISNPDFGIITNIGDSHLEFLKNRENVYKAKTELLKYVTPDKTILFGDDYYLKNIPGIKVGFESNNDFQIKNFIDTENGVKFLLENYNYELSLNGRHNAINASMAIVVAKKLGLSSEGIEKGLKNIKISAMRFEKMEKENIIYINDAYNASPVSMCFSLETFSNLYKDKVKIAVLGDMLELGDNEINYHKEVIDKASSLEIDKIFLYGPRMEKAYNLVENKENKNIKYFNNKEDIKVAIREIPEKKAILLKGSRGMKMEEIIEK